MSEENIENITKSENHFAPTFVDHHLLPDITFDGDCLITKIVIPKIVRNFFISYTLTRWLRNLITYFTLTNSLFGSVKLAKNADPGKYKYSGYDIRI